MQEVKGDESGNVTPSKPLSSSGTDNHPPMTPGIGQLGEDIDQKLREFGSLEFSSDPGFNSLEPEYRATSQDTYIKFGRRSISGNPVNSNTGTDGRGGENGEINQLDDEDAKAAQNYEEVLLSLINKRDANLQLQKELLFAQNQQIKDKEKQALAKDLGLDLTLESQRFSHFLNMAVQVNLPIGWKLEITPGGKIYYFNELERIYSDSHPSLAFFKRLLSNNYKRILNKIGTKVAQGNTKRHTLISKSDM